MVPIPKLLILEQSSLGSWMSGFSVLVTGQNYWEALRGSSETFKLGSFCRPVVAVSYNAKHGTPICARRMYTCMRAISNWISEWFTKYEKFGTGYVNCKQKLISLTPTVMRAPRVIYLNHIFWENLNLRIFTNYHVFLKKWSNPRITEELLDEFNSPDIDINSVKYAVCYRILWANAH